MSKEQSKAQTLRWSKMSIKKRKKFGKKISLAKTGMKYKMKKINYPNMEEASRLRWSKLSNLRRKEIGQNISLAKKGIPIPEERKRRIAKTLTGRRSPKKGKRLTDSQRKACEEYWESLKGKKLSKKHKRKIREGVIKYQEKTGLNVPCFGRFEKQILDSYESALNVTILRQYKVAGYFLDGYCPNFNLAFEVDEPQHFDRFEKLSEKDKVRQKEIEEELGCRFIRVKVPRTF